MDLSAVEDDIISRLLSEISTNTPKIRSFPTNPKEFQLLHPKGAILVRYNGSTSEVPDPNNQAKAVQTTVCSWVVNIVTKSLKKEKGHQGTYALIESVREALVGYTITGLPDASIMYHVNDGFEDETAGTWIYRMAFAFNYDEGET